MSIKDVRISLAFFDTPLPQVGILTLIYLTSTVSYLATLEFETPSPQKKYSDVFFGWPCAGLTHFVWKINGYHLEMRAISSSILSVLHNGMKTFLKWHSYIHTQDILK